MLLDVTVSSLNDNSHVSSLFRVNSMDLYENRYSSIEEVMKLLLKHLTNSTVSNTVCKIISKKIILFEFKNIKQ